MQSNRWLQTLIVLLVIIASIYLAGMVFSFLMLFSNIILLFFLAWLLAFALRPLARWLTSHGLPQGMAVLLVYVALALIFGIGGFLLVPVISEQISQLIANFNNYVNEIARLVNQGQGLLISWGVRDVDINQFYSEVSSQVQTIGMSVLQNTFSVLQSVATLMLQSILVLLLSFYFMKDGEKIFGGVLHLLPPRWQDEARLLALSIERSFGGFVRGQLLFALVYAIFTAVVMLFFKLDYVVIAAMVAGLCMIIPLVGNFLAFVPPLLVCLVTKPQDWLWLLVWLFIAQSFVMNFVGPRIMSQAIGIHPLFVVAAMLVGGQVAGFWGALFGIPIAGAANLVGRPLMRRIRHEVPLYQEVKGERLTTTSFTTGPLAAAMLEAKSKPAQAERQHDNTQPIMLDDLDDSSTRTPTLSGRAWHFVWVFVSRAYLWVGARAHVRASKR